MHGHVRVENASKVRVQKSEEGVGASSGIVVEECGRCAESTDAQKVIGMKMKRLMKVGE